MIFTSEAYAKLGGTRCPVCQGADLDGQSLTVDAGQCTQAIVCNGCGAIWTDVYTLTGYEDLKEGDPMTYKIVRVFANNDKKLTLLTGLTLVEAQTYCRDPETSSTTATGRTQCQLTDEAGPWFDAYYRED